MLNIRVIWRRAMNDQGSCLLKVHSFFPPFFLINQKIALGHKINTVVKSNRGFIKRIKRKGSKLRVGLQEQVFSLKNKGNLKLKE